MNRPNKPKSMTLERNAMQYVVLLERYCDGLENDFNNLLHMYQLAIEDLNRNWENESE